MNNVQLYFAIAVPILSNAVMFTLLILYINAKIDGVNQGVNQRFEAVNQRLDDMRNLWLSELHRVEEVLDARLKRLEEDWKEKR